ncbi:hypothetical protein DL765_006300 [Monosporascus sp. GIB2]|nr:hypothetical protein DL765_006300 [Monosporascus sp. GIB2]
MYGVALDVSRVELGEGQHVRADSLPNIEPQSYVKAIEREIACRDGDEDHSNHLFYKLGTLRGLDGVGRKHTRLPLLSPRSPGSPLAVQDDGLQIQQPS